MLIMRMPLSWCLAGNVLLWLPSQPGILAHQHLLISNEHGKYSKHRMSVFLQVIAQQIWNFDPALGARWKRSNNDIIPFILQGALFICWDISVVHQHWISHYYCLNSFPEFQSEWRARYLQRFNNNKDSSGTKMTHWQVISCISVTCISSIHS